MSRESATPPEACASIEDVRREIDDLDRSIVALIGSRARYVETAAKFKTGESSVRAPERQKSMLAERRRWAEDEHLDPDVVEAIYKTLLEYFVSREMGHWRRVPRSLHPPTATIGNDSH